MKTNVKNDLLDEAQTQIQTKGFQGFSYHDLSRAVKITTASIHYHFPTKEALGVALVRRYRTTVRDSLSKLALEPVTLRAKLRKLAALYSCTFKAGGRACVASALAGEYHGLPAAVRTELDGLVRDSIEGIRYLIESGQPGIPVAKGQSLQLAKLWYATLQGSLNLSRASQPDLVNDVAATLLLLTLPERRTGLQSS